MTPDTSAKRQFAVVTDSTADIATEMVQDLGVTVVPLAVTIDGETLDDGVLTQAQFFERMRSAPDLPTTSQPSVGVLVEAYEQALKTADSVISLHISSKLSGTVEAARIAAEQFAGKVSVFDSRNLSWGLAWQVVDAVAAAGEGLGVPEALERLERAREQVKLLVGVDSLENLRRGGRIGAVSSLLGSMLNLKVTLTVDENGAFAPLGRSRGEKAALEYTMDWIATQMGTATSGRFAVGHALSEERAHRIAASIRERWDATEMVIYEAGSVVAAHTGTVWGVAVWPAI
ncbi:MAG: DegV family protein [Coriobacteriia bacterium]|nr:DegV family protein [Coriobacteriia bacterium]